MDHNDNPINNITDPVLRKLAIITGDFNNILEIKDNDINIVTEFIKRNRYYHNDKINLFYKNEEFCQIMIENEPFEIDYMDKELSNYNELCKRSVYLNYTVLSIIDKDIPDYEECCLEACRQNGLSLSYVDFNKIKNINKLIDISIENYPECIEFIPKRKLTDEMIDKAINKNGNCIQYISTKKINK